MASPCEQLPVQRCAVHRPARRALRALPSIRLLIFPGGGEACLAYDAALQTLPDSVDVCVVSLPGRGPRRGEPCTTSADEIADGVHAALRALVPSCTPLVVFGHSAGCVLAAVFVARYESVLPIFRVVLSSHPGPRCSTAATEALLNEADDAEFVRRCGASGILDASLAEAAARDRDAARLVAQPMRADFAATAAAIARWREEGMPELHVPVVVCRGDRDPSVLPEDLDGWLTCDASRSACGGTQARLVVVGGGHDFPVRPELAAWWHRVVFADRVSCVRGSLREHYPVRRIEELVAVQAQAAPNAVALVFEGRTTTYAQLMGWAELVCASVLEAARREQDRRQQLLGPAGDPPAAPTAEAGAELRVGIMLPRSDAYVAVMLGALMAGAAFIPVDVAYSPPVLEHILAATAPCVVFAQACAPAESRAQAGGHLHSLLAVAPPRPMEASPPPCKRSPAVAPGHMSPAADAMIALSSGTTGLPKGIPVSHAAMAHAYTWQARHVPMHARAASSVFFVWECLRPLVVGNTTVVVPDDVLRDPSLHLGLLRAEAVADTLVTPSVLAALLQELDAAPTAAHLPALRCMRVCGEVMQAAIAASFHRLLPHARLFDLYSLCETHDVASFEYRADGEVRMVVLPDMCVQIRSTGDCDGPGADTPARAQPGVLPLGAVGEVFVSGPALSRGYIGHGDSAAVFSVDAATGERWYATGDLGLLELAAEPGAVATEPVLRLLGRRKGGMVKIRGYSVVVPAVWTALQCAAGVRAAALQVLHFRGGATPGQPEALCAYVVLAAGHTVANVRAELARVLHPAWVPAFFVPMHALPTSAVSQKLESARLPDPRASPAAGVAPPESEARSAAEAAVAAAWASALGAAPGSLDEANFFESGGDSLSAAVLTRALRQAGWEVSVADVYACPQPSALALRIAPAQGGAAAPGSVGAITGQSRVRGDAADASADADPDAFGDAASGEGEGGAARAVGAQVVPQACGSCGSACSTPIAIVGASCEFRGCPSLPAFWRAICAAEPPLATSARDLRPGGVTLTAADIVDAGWWGLSVAEVERMDPQHALFMSHCAAALVDAGLPPTRAPLRTGVFGGCYLPGGGSCDGSGGVGPPTCDLPAGQRHLAETGWDKDYLCLRVAHLLDLRGPAVTVQTSCSTSLVAVAAACSSLAAGECDAALAGAASLGAQRPSSAVSTPATAPAPVEGDLHSASGSVRAFDASADGTVLTDGAGIVLLKRLDDALAGGHRVLAVVRGWAVNNDGARTDKASFLAPSASGQAACLRAALAHARARAEDVGYIEAHGTGTVVGDAVELRAIASVYGADPQLHRRTYVGSCKPTVGHANIAAGMAGLLKAVKCLEQRVIPVLHNFWAQPDSVPPAEASAIVLPRAPLHCDDIDREAVGGGARAGRHALPATAAACTLDWAELVASGRAGALAAVSCFGVGGTNVHVILEAAPARRSSATPAAPASQVPLCVAAASSAARTHVLQALRGTLGAAGGETRAGACAAWTLTQRTALHWRAVSLDGGGVWHTHHLGDASHSARVVLLFPGQGTRGPGMCAAAVHTSPIRPDWARMHALALRATGCNLDAALDARDAGTEQLVIVALQLAGVRALRRLGLARPAALVGHSVGLLAALCVAGHLSEREALRLALARGRAVARHAPPGAMLACIGVRADTLRRMVASEAVWVAVDAGPSSVVLAGTAAAIEHARARVTPLLDGGAAATRALHGSFAFHSPLMHEAAVAFEQAAALELNPTVANDHGLEADTWCRTPSRSHAASPGIPVMCNLTGLPLSCAEARSPAYWRRQMEEPVLLGACLRQAAEFTGSAATTCELAELQRSSSSEASSVSYDGGGDLDLDTGCTSWVDVGPGNSLAALAVSLVASRPGVSLAAPSLSAVACSPAPKQAGDSVAAHDTWWRCAALLWLRGLAALPATPRGVLPHLLRSAVVPADARLPQPWAPARPAAGMLSRRPSSAPQGRSCDAYVMRWRVAATVPAAAVRHDFPVLSQLCGPSLALDVWSADGSGQGLIKLGSALSSGDRATAATAAAAAGVRLGVALLPTCGSLSPSAEIGLIAWLAPRLRLGHTSPQPEPFVLLLLHAADGDGGSVGYSAAEGLVAPLILSVPGARVISARGWTDTSASLLAALHFLGVPSHGSRVMRLASDGSTWLPSLEALPALVPLPSPSSNGRFFGKCYVVHGGTGHIGRLLVRALRLRGARAVWIASRRPGAPVAGADASEASGELHAVVRTAEDVAALAKHVHADGVFLCATAFPPVASGAFGAAELVSQFLAERACKGDVVHALAVLESPPPLLVCFSSLAALLGGASPNLAAYGAANASASAALEGARRSRLAACVSVHWDDWDNVPGRAPDHCIRGDCGIAWLLDALLPAEIASSGGLVASADPLVSHRFAAWQGGGSARAAPTVAQRLASVEARVIHCYRSALSDAAVTPSSKFVDHGGSSITALTLCSLLHDVGLHVSLDVVLSAETPAQLVSMLAREGESGCDTLADDLAHE